MDRAHRPEQIKAIIKNENIFLSPADKIHFTTSLLRLRPDQKIKLAPFLFPTCSVRIAMIRIVFSYCKIQFVLLISRQGKVRLTKWYSPYTQKERSKVIRELSGVILTRGPKLCNFVEWRGHKVVYKRYASLYFCMGIDQEDNELEVLEIIHHYVEILDRYFGSVCELDLIFNFHKAYYALDELLIAGELQESSKKTVARLIAAQDSLVEAAKEQASSLSNIISQATK
uniref:Adaptor AP-1 19 kDa protein n=2 Tax=Salix viminalis TaxID=40686 RepID=A0A6N2MSK3_SALVM